MDSRAEGVMIVAVHFGLMNSKKKIINLSKRRVKNGRVGTRNCSFFFNFNPKVILGRFDWEKEAVGS